LVQGSKVATTFSSTLELASDAAKLTKC